MQPAKAEQIPIEQSIFVKGWNMVKKYHNISPNECPEIWQQVADEAQAIYETGTDPATIALSKAVALGVLEYIETRSKERKVQK